MLRLDQFDSHGRWLYASEDHKSDDKAGAKSVAIADHPSILAPYFLIPNDMLQRLVKNKHELASLQRIGELVTQLDTLIEAVAPSKTLNPTMVCNENVLSSSAQRDIISPPGIVAICANNDR